MKSVIIKQQRSNGVERMEFLAKKAAGVDDSLEVLGYTEAEFARAHNSIFGEIISKEKYSKFIGERFFNEKRATGM